MINKGPECNEHELATDKRSLESDLEIRVFNHVVTTSYPKSKFEEVKERISSNTLHYHDLNTSHYKGYRGKAKVENGEFIALMHGKSEPEAN